MITSPADTLVCDSAQLAAFRSDAAYDYNRELITPEINIFEWIRGLGFHVYGLVELEASLWYG